MDSFAAKLRMVPCPSCSSERHKRLFRRQGSTAESAIDPAQVTTDTFDNYGQVVKCLECGFTFRNPRPDPDAVLEAYASMQDENYLVEDHSRAMNAHLSLHFISQLKAKGRLLDVGCFTGLLLNASRLNFEPVGIEPSHWAAAIARDRGNLNVIQGAFGKVSLPPDSFDVVTMVDVIEHFADPLAALREAHTLLRPGGLLYIVTPDLGSLSAALLGRFWWGFRSAHLVYFTRGTLEKMLQTAGFKVVKMRSYGRMFTYRYWASRLKNYPRPVAATARFIETWLGISDKVAYINTFDSVEVCAIKQ